MVATFECNVKLFQRIGKAWQQYLQEVMIDVDVAAHPFQNFGRVDSWDNDWQCILLADFGSRTWCARRKISSRIGFAKPAGQCLIKSSRVNRLGNMILHSTL